MTLISLAPLGLGDLLQLRAERRCRHCQGLFGELDAIDHGNNITRLRLCGGGPGFAGQRHHETKRQSGELKIELSRRHGLSSVRRNRHNADWKPAKL